MTRNNPDKQFFFSSDTLCSYELALFVCRNDFKEPGAFSDAKDTGADIASIENSVG